MRPTPTPAAGTVPVAVHGFPHRTPIQLLALARHGLAEAERLDSDGLRYATAHLAALRAAAAVLAARARPAPGRRNRVSNVWSLLTLVAPDLSEWATYFSASAAKRAAAEAGIPRVVSAREADDLVRAATSFVDAVEDALGIARPFTFDELVA
ncbi:MAG TPA: SAV_6107 family HEPN domain-containing protein [Micromonosporaceae bacterium]